MKLPLTSTAQTQAGDGNERVGQRTRHVAETGADRQGTAHVAMQVHKRPWRQNNGITSLLSKLKIQDSRGATRQVRMEQLYGRLHLKHVGGAREGQHPET